VGSVNDIKTAVKLTGEIRKVRKVGANISRQNNGFLLSVISGYKKSY